MDEAKLIKRFKRACNELNAVMEEWKKLHPDGEYYLQSENLHLMTGPSHDWHGKRQDKNSTAMVTLPGSGGGDW